MNARILVITGILAAAIGLNIAPVQAASFKIDSAHTSVVFKVKHVGYSNEIGRAHV